MKRNTESNNYRTELEEDVYGKNMEHTENQSRRVIKIAEGIDNLNDPVSTIFHSHTGPNIDTSLPQLYSKRTYSTLKDIEC